MKKNTLFFISIILLVVLVSCNSQEKQLSSVQANDSTENFVKPAFTKADSVLVNDFCIESGSGNFVIDSVEAKEMITHFKDIYKKNSSGQNLEGLKTTFWIDKCLIFALERHLYNVGTLKGVRVFFGCSKTDDRTSTIFIVPTTTEIKAHPEVWDQPIPGSDCAGETASDYFSKHINAIERIQQFELFYRERKVINGPAIRDSLTSKVWIDKCVIKSLANTIRADTSLDGVNIEMGAYKKVDRTRALGQINKDQSTIILVPTIPGTEDGTHENSWTTTEKLYNLAIALKKAKAYNHGELCPDKCP